jgi:cholesterol transport system auxiliary component
MADRLNPEVQVNKSMNSVFRFFAMSGIVVLSACGFSREAYEPVQSYVLEIEGESEVLEIDRSRSQNLPGLLVSLPEPAPGFESPRMVYVKMPHELNYYATSQWVEPPARMLAPLIVQRLESSGRWSAVAHMPTPVRGDVRLEIDQVALAQEFLQQPSRVRLGLRAQLLTVYDPHVIGTRRFDIREDAPSEDAYGGVLAAQRAVRRLLDDLTEWLEGCFHGNQAQPC